jgi:hypothetical protein
MSTLVSSTKNLVGDLGWGDLVAERCAKGGPGRSVREISELKRECLSTAQVTYQAPGRAKKRKALLGGLPQEGF